MAQILEFSDKNFQVAINSKKKKMGDRNSLETNGRMEQMENLRKGIEDIKN